MKIKCCETSKPHGVTKGKTYEVVKHNKSKNIYRIINNTKVQVNVFGFSFEPPVDKEFDKFIDKCDLTGMEQYQ